MSGAAGTAARPLPGIGLMLAAALCFAGLDTTTRVLGAQMPLLVMLWSRYTFQAAVMAPWLARGGWRGLRSAHPRFQVARGLLLLFTSAMSFIALQHLPVPEFTAIAMLTPVLVALLAHGLLHEPLSRLRRALVAGAFVGALVVIRPGAGLFGWAVLFPLVGAVSYAAFQLLSSRLASLESPLVTHFHTGLVGTVAMSVLLGFSATDLAPALRAASPRELGLLLMMGLLGTAGHLCLILALARGSAASLMPFLYAQIGFAALLAWWATGHLPDAWAWVGMSIIGVCGAASAWLNLSQAPATRSAVAQDTIAD